MSTEGPDPEVEQERTPHRGILLDLAPLRVSSAFRWLYFGNIVGGIGAQMTVVAVGLEVYAITGSTLAVALVGVVALVPMILAGLYGGMLVDAFDRRTVLLASSLLAWFATIGIASLSWLGLEAVWALYLLTMLNSVAATVAGAARQAILPRLVGTKLVPAASALTGITYGVMITAGPALAGVLVATVGFAWTYTVDVVLFLAALAGILHLPAVTPIGERHAPGLQSIRSGLAFLRRAPNIRMSFLVDILAMTFGRPHALFPAVGALLLGGGAVTVGLLTAAQALGTLLSSVFSGRVAEVRRQGVAIGWAIAGYGLSILAFGMVLGWVSWFGETGDAANPNPLAILLALVCMAASGATDNVSAIFRQTILMTAAPDNMRGRLQGIFVVVVTGGPRLGDLYVGLVALAGVLWLPPLIGGALIVALIALMLRVQSTFRHYDSRHPMP
ncbi:MFS transporter [Leifsonia sp. H3M29-4]|uniref:MFS transporter n=1 Tax=Salinibacterium metalliresistens TaxID=3031321 RepID=UPI0023D9891E|nr:MFS transporter [Salinibacterium metalliresistens]MDF1480193.1 MFS transporter [Salinibacterium metalliresistens]